MTDTPSIGIDIGGTKMLGCVFGADDGKALRSITLPTADGGEAVLRQTVRMVADLRDGIAGPIRSIGIAVPELVSRAGRPTSSWNFDWRNLDVASALEEDCPVRIDSDVRAAAYAESRLSPGGSRDPLLYVTWSTGIAHTLVIGGRPYLGARGYALHFSGTDLVTRCEHCHDMSRYNLELFAAGRALGERHSEAAGKTGLSARDLFNAADHDAVARRMADDALLSIASYLGQLINTLDPAVMVIGGGIGARPDVFGRLNALIRDFIWADDARDLPIEPSSLDGKAAAIGAVLLAKEFRGGEP